MFQKLHAIRSPSRSPPYVAQSSAPMIWGDMLVGVHAAERVDAAAHRVQQLVVVEVAGRGDETAVAGDAVQADQGGDDAAVLASDVDRPHPVALRLGQAAEPAVGPEAHLQRDAERLVAAGVFIAVEQAGHDLVEGVVRRPDRRIGDVLLQQVELLLAVAAEESPRIALALVQRLLAFGERLHHAADLGEDDLVSGAVVGQGERGEEVPGGVAAQVAFGAVPAGHRRGALHVQAGGLAEVVQHAALVDVAQELEAGGDLAAQHAVAVEAGVRADEVLARGLGPLAVAHVGMGEHDIGLRLNRGAPALHMAGGHADVALDGTGCGVVAGGCRAVPRHRAHLAAAVAQMDHRDRRQLRRLAGEGDDAHVIDGDDGGLRLLLQHGDRVLALLGAAAVAGGEVQLHVAVADAEGRPRHLAGVREEQPLPRGPGERAASLAGVRQVQIGVDRAQIAEVDVVDVAVEQIELLDGSHDDVVSL